MFFALLCVAFDSSHCRQKCESSYGESPKKKALCLDVCSSGTGTRERVQFGQPQMKKEVVSCLAKCNQNVNSTTEFRSWAKCRKTCATDPDTEEREFISSPECSSGCDRYWKGTVHWKPCQDQCTELGRSESPAQAKKPNGRPVW
jgi:hypothetical protein